MAYLKYSWAKKYYFSKTKTTCGLLMVVLRAVQDENKKAIRDFLLCFFLLIKIKKKEVLLLCYQNTVNLMDRAPSGK